MRTDESYMSLALELAREAARLGEVPVGAVAVWDGEVVGTGFNRRETGKNALAHAELEAIDAACRKLGGWRLHRCDLYVTLEPCPMCAGAIVQARPGRIVFGATDERMGAVGGALSLFELPGVNHRPWVRRGVMAQEAKTLLADFFAARRGAKENEREGEGEVR